MSPPVTARADTPASFSAPAGWSTPRFVLTHACLPLAAFCLALVSIQLFGIDQRLADVLFAGEGHAWALKDAFITERLLHRGGHHLSLAAWLVAFVIWIGSLWGVRHQRWRRPLAYLVVASLLSTTLVAWIKGWSNMDCPWDLVRYGGRRPFIGLLDVKPLGLGRGVCFPAAHASAGYCWLALYFFLAVVRPRLRMLGLLTGLALGLLFGIGQQLRGAHFLSHDLWSLAICWTVSLLLSRLFWPAEDSVPAGLGASATP